jgi:hypothetical protein
VYEKNKIHIDNSTERNVKRDSKWGANNLKSCGLERLLDVSISLFSSYCGNIRIRIPLKLHNMEFQIYYERKYDTEKYTELSSPADREHF